MGFCGWFGLKVRGIGVLWRFWGKAEVKWGPVVVWGESEGKLGSYGGFGLKVRGNGVLWWI